jgi:hypothetical protein
MADNIVDITFTDVTILEIVGSTPFVASITGTLEVDYTAGTVTNCALTASGTGFITTSFTTATLVAQSFGQFTVNATGGINNTLQFTYTGFQPDNLFFLDLTLGSFSPSFVGPPIPRQHYHIDTGPLLRRRRAHPHAARRCSGRDAQGRRSRRYGYGRVAPS